MQDPARPAEAPTRESNDVVASLPPVESLTIESDFSPFFQPKVPEELRRKAVKKLFADPHFNVMDGLDTYIDDYSKPDPILPGMLRQINHAYELLGFGDEDRKAAAEACRPGERPAPDLIRGRDPSAGGRGTSTEQVGGQANMGPGFRRDDSMEPSAAVPLEPASNSGTPDTASRND